MEVINPRLAHLTNHETLSLFLSQKSHQDTSLASLASLPSTTQSDRDHIAPPPLRTLLVEGLAYFEKGYVVTARQDGGGMKRLLDGLEGYSVRGGRDKGLTKAERLMICDLGPTQAVELYLIVEECELRFTDREVDEIIALVASTLSARTHLTNGTNHTNGAVKNEDEDLYFGTEEEDARVRIFGEEDEEDDALVAEGLGNGGGDVELDEVPD